MSELETFAREQIETLIADIKNLKLSATVSDTSYSVEFFITVDGERKQCYELADAGVFDEEDLDNVLSKIAVFIRGMQEYESGKVNIIVI